jgi:single stranded DNA-binding protein
MYLNRITLIGFLGGDAEKKGSNATNIAVFSLATKTSWKNDAGTWESRTEWHRCVAFGRLAEFAGSLAKGAHVAIEGDLRSHEYSGRSCLAIRGLLSRSESGKSASNPSSNSTAPPSGNQPATATRRRPAKGHFLTRYREVYPQLSRKRESTIRQVSLFRQPIFRACTTNRFGALPTK